MKTCRWIVSKPWSARFWSRIAYRLPGSGALLTACPICGCAAQPMAGNTISRILRCGACGHAFAEKRASDWLVRWVYRGWDYWRIDKWYRDVPTEWEGCIEARLDILERIGLHRAPPRRRVFELGCSEGSILKPLQDMGHEVLGNDVNAAIAAYGARRYGVPIRPGLFETLELPSNHFDFAYSFHTLEHLRDPHAIIARLADLLRTDGSLLIEVPSNEREYRNLDHLHFFSAASLEQLLHRHFHSVELLPNRYRHHSGSMEEALYGIGRLPRRP